MWKEHDDYVDWRKQVGRITPNEPNSLQSVSQDSSDTHRKLGNIHNRYASKCVQDKACQLLSDSVVVEISKV